MFDIGDYKVKTADGELLYSEAMKDAKSFAEWCVAYDKFFEASIDGKLYAVMSASGRSRARPSTHATLSLISFATFENLISA